MNSLKKDLNTPTEKYNMVIRKMVQLNGIYTRVFPDPQVVLIYRYLIATIEENSFDEFIIRYSVGKSTKKLIKYLEEQGISYIKIGDDIEVKADPYYFGVKDLKDLIKRLRSKRFLEDFAEKVMPVQIL